jgi:2-methylcitrate dehydratase PrpD
MHLAIFATLQLREEERVQPNDIVGIRIGTNRMCSEFLAQPKELKWNPPTQVAAKFSPPYRVSVAAAKGAVGILEFERQALSNPDVHRLLAVTSVELDADIELADAANRFSIVSIFRVVIRRTHRHKKRWKTNCVNARRLRRSSSQRRGCPTSVRRWIRYPMQRILGNLWI